MDKIIPTIEIFNHYEKIYVDDDTAQKLINGVKINITDLERFLLINEKYNLIMIGHRANSELKLKRVA